MTQKSSGSVNSAIANTSNLIHLGRRYEMICVSIQNEKYFAAVGSCTFKTG